MNDQGISKWRLRAVPSFFSPPSHVNKRWMGDYGPFFTKKEALPQFFALAEKVALVATVLLPCFGSLGSVFF